MNRSVILYFSPNLIVMSVSLTCFSIAFQLAASAACSSAQPPKLVEKDKLRLVDLTTPPRKLHSVSNIDRMSDTESRKDLDETVGCSP